MYMAINWPHAHYTVSISALVHWLPEAMNLCVQLTCVSWSTWPEKGECVPREKQSLWSSESNKEAHCLSVVSRGRKGRGSRGPCLAVVTQAELCADCLGKSCCSDGWGSKQIISSFSGSAHRCFGFWINYD